MRILIHTDEYYPTAQACSYRMQVFAESFSMLGNDITVITSSANKANGIINQCRKEKIIYAPAIRMKKKTAFMRMLNNMTFSISSFFSAFGVGKIDIVITTSPPPLISISGWLIAKLKSAKLVYDVRDIWPDVAIEMGSFSENSFFYKVFKKITLFMCRYSDAITTVSLGKIDKIKRYLCTDKWQDLPSTDNVWLIGNGFDENIVNSKFDQAIIDQYDLDRKFTCVYIGNIGLAQGLGTFLEIAKKTKHKNIQFLCFGMGAEKEFLENKAKSENLTNVKFCGIIEHSKVYSILSKANISFIPLKNSNMKDSIPTKIYEALGMGCPVFLVAEGDATNIIDESGLGRHVSPSKPEKIIDVFDNMVNHYDDFITNKDRAISLMHTKYSRQKIAIDFERKLKSLLK